MSTWFFSRAFFPLFMVQFLAALNDNLYKNAMVMLIAFQLSQNSEETGLYITLAAGLFILPFFLFSSLAGQLADHYPKWILIRKIQLSEILIMLTGAIGFITMQVEWLFAALFLMGTQSAFFGPIKYSVLPEILSEQQLLRGNAWFSGSTFIAILLGTILGGSLVIMETGPEWIAGMVISLAIIGYGFSLWVPQTQQASEKVIVEKNFLKSTWAIIQSSRVYKEAFFAVLSISWFWFIGAVLLSQIPSFVKYTLQANEQVVILFLTLFSVGIAVGTLLVSQLMKQGLTLRWHGLILLLIGASLAAALWVVNGHALAPVEEGVALMGLSQFLWESGVSLTALFLFLLAVFGGAYIVPLYTQLQTKTPKAARARMVAVNNIINAFLMVLSSILIMLGYALDLTLTTMLWMVVVLNVMVAGWFVTNVRRHDEVVG